MGCDGGTIPKRNEVVKNRQKDSTRDREADRQTRWQFCSLSGLPLKKPIVACYLGRLFNKDAIIEYLLELKTGAAPQPAVAHIRSLADVKDLNLKNRTSTAAANNAAATGGSNGSQEAQSAARVLGAQFQCSITGLELNGTYKFLYIRSCGCVLSERALKEVPNDKSCIVCHRPYESPDDLIPINDDESETLLRERHRARRAAKRQAKRTANQLDGVANAKRPKTTSASSDQTKLQ